MSATRTNVPSDLETRRIVSRALMDAGRDVLTHWVPAQHGGVPKQAAIAAGHQVFAYVPQSVWSHSVKIPFWGFKDCGRPDASSNGTKSTKSTKSTKRTSGSTPTKRTSTPTKRTSTKSTPTKRTSTKSTPTKSPTAQSKDNAVHAAARVASPATVAALHASLPNNASES